MEMRQSWEGQCLVTGGRSLTALPAGHPVVLGFPSLGLSSMACTVPRVPTAVWVLHSQAEPRGPETIRKRIMGLRKSYPAACPDHPTDSAIRLLEIALASPRTWANTDRLQSKASRCHFLRAGDSPMYGNVTASSSQLYKLVVTRLQDG